MRIADMPDITKLTTPEKIILVEDLWDSISADETAVPIPASHQEELNRRLTAYRSAPGSLLSLEELQSHLLLRK